MLEWSKAGKNGSATEKKAQATDPNAPRPGANELYGEYDKENKGGGVGTALDWFGGQPTTGPENNMLNVNPGTPMVDMSSIEGGGDPTAEEAAAAASSAGAASLETSGQPSGAVPFDPNGYNPSGYNDQSGFGYTQMQSQNQLNDVMSNMGDRLIEKAEQNQTITSEDFNPARDIPKSDMAEFELKAREFVQRMKSDLISEILEKLRTHCKPTLERIAEDTLSPEIYQELVARGWHPFVTERAAKDLIASMEDALL